MSELDTSALEPGQGLVRFRITLHEVNGRYQSQVVQMNKAVLTLVSQSSPGKTIPMGLHLDVLFEPNSGTDLASVFPPMAGMSQGIYSYSFEMKPDVFETHKQAINQAVSPDDWVQIGPFVCLDLANYTCLGHIKL